MTFVEKCLFNYQNPSFCVFVLINLRTALTWAETCSSTHVQVITYNKACVVSDEKLYPVYVCKIHSPQQAGKVELCFLTKNYVFSTVLFFRLLGCRLY